MNVHNHRARPGEPLRRQIKKAGDIAAVERLPVDQLRLAEFLRVEAAGFARGPALERALFDIDRIDVRRAACRAEAETQIASIVVPLEPGDHAARHRGQRQVLARGCIHNS